MKKKKTVHLICNAHLDPVWLWQWPEGAGEAISTFRIAADFCEEYDGFVFNHNEVILYEWVEEYEPSLFKRIQKLVKEGRWHIMGGWYLQPDCNMPSGESLVRQTLMGRWYFKDKFGAVPKTAINFDPFGHSRGMVQILQKAGYDSYLFARPNKTEITLPDNDFIWVGLENSSVIGHRISGGYNSQKGLVREKIENWIKEFPDKDPGIVLWGIGNHGGGPSRNDLNQLTEFIQTRNDVTIVHSTPEAYFIELQKSRTKLRTFAESLIPTMIGCYTSQIRVKQKHRQLENELFLTEKMLSSAAINNLLPYPKDDMRVALKDLLFSEFHDILPGSGIKPVEEDAIRLMDHGLEILSRMKTKAFFALSTGEPAAEEDVIPILAYNPHPYSVKGIFECEFQPAAQNWKEEFSFPAVYQNGRRVPCQAEKEESNINLDWRKKSVFYAELAPMQMNRFDVRLEIMGQKPKSTLKPIANRIIHKTSDMEVIVNCKTGLIDSIKIGKKNIVKTNSFLPIVIKDDMDPWGMRVKSFRNLAGNFRLMTQSELVSFAGVDKTSKQISPVNIIEDGEVRTVIEVHFRWNDSIIRQRYKLPKYGTEIEVELDVLWNETEKMLKLSVPTALIDGECLGQTVFGHQRLFDNRQENVFQKWMMVRSIQSNLSFSCINDGTYACDFLKGEVRLSLLRSPAYSAHPIPNRPVIPNDRSSPRIDQGQRNFRFWFNFGDSSARLSAIDREALVHNEKAVLLSFFPSGTGKKPMPSAILDDESIQIAAIKPAENGKGYILRLFEPTGYERKTTLHIPHCRISKKISFKGFEVKTFLLNPSAKKLSEIEMMEMSVS
jgi:alpha-mannosidase